MARLPSICSGPKALGSVPQHLQTNTDPSVSPSTLDPTVDLEDDKNTTNLSESVHPSNHPTRTGAAGACDAKMRLSRRESAERDGGREGGGGGEPRGAHRQRSAEGNPGGRRPACPTNGNGCDRGAVAASTPSAAEGKPGFNGSLPLSRLPRLR